MVLKSVSAAVAAAVLACGGAAAAADYRPDQFLGLDLSKALLSPQRLGPPSHFAPVPVEAKTDVKTDATASAKDDSKGAGEARAESEAPKQIITERVRRAPRMKLAHANAERPHASARTRLAHRHGNPLDAQAFDTRIQVWPCRSGGICNWKR